MASPRKTIRLISQKTKTSKTTQSKSKIDEITDALRSAKGATITDLSLLTGWQPHSVRAALAGKLKKKRGLAVTSAKRVGERVDRVASRS